MVLDRCFVTVQDECENMNGTFLQPLPLAFDDLERSDPRSCTLSASKIPTGFTRHLCSVGQQNRKPVMYFYLQPSTLTLCDLERSKKSWSFLWAASQTLYVTQYLYEHVSRMFISV